MDKKLIENFLIDKESGLLEAMKKIDNNANGLVFVTDYGKLVGALSDGDIRRWLINTGNLSVKVAEIMNTSPKSVSRVETDKAYSIMQNTRIHAIPITDSENNIVDIVLDKQLDESNVEKKSGSLKNIPIIIMAGGKGSRLYPYTKILPKPLIPINDVPILERVLKQFSKYNAKDIYISVNYKKEMIKSYFREVDCGYELKYIEEDIPLGTAGSIRMVSEELTGNIIVTNCDILIHADYSEIVRYHESSGNAITIVSAMLESTIPYGVIKQGERGFVKSMEEKPTFPYIVNTGMYIVDSDYLDRIPPNTFFHMTDLVNKLLEEGKQIGMYPVSEDSFLDMGEFTEMQRMEDKLKESLIYD